MDDSGKSNIIRLVITIALAWAPGIIDSMLFATGDESWYQQLDKPWFNPPSWVFGPVWSILYIGMGISLYLIWTRGNRSRRWYRLVAVFVVQLILNRLWPPAFFGLESPIAGLIVTSPLLITVAATITLARPISGIAALILMPYLLWVTLATTLKFSIWQLN